MGKQQGRADQTAASGRRASRWRIAGWGGAALLLLLPFVAMQLTDEVNWTAADFIVMGGMLALAGGAVELGASVSRDFHYRAAIVVAVFTGFLLIWVNLAVGILGSEGNPANLMFAIVLGVAAVGALVVRLAASGMTRVMIATASAQVLAGLVALAGGLASQGARGVYEVALGSGLFGALWLLSAWLFARAAASVPAQADLNARSG